MMSLGQQPRGVDEADAVAAVFGGKPLRAEGFEFFVHGALERADFEHDDAVRLETFAGLHE